MRANGLYRRANADSVGRKFTSYQKIIWLINLGCLGCAVVSRLLTNAATKTACWLLTNVIYNKMRLLAAPSSSQYWWLQRIEIGDLWYEQRRAWQVHAVSDEACSARCFSVSFKMKISPVGWLFKSRNSSANSRALPAKHKPDLSGRNAGACEVFQRGCCSEPVSEAPSV